MTDAELAILSIVAEGPIIGEDIQTIINQRGLRVWTNIGTSSMYYVLQKLARQGLIESSSQQEGPARRQYRITPAGFGVLQTAVADLISTSHEHANSFELGLANLHVLRPSQIRTAFTTYRQELLSRLTQTRERWRQLKAANAPFNVDAMFGHNVAMLEAEIEWIKNFIEAWEAQAPPDEDELPPAKVADIPRMKQVVLPHHPDSPHKAPTRRLHPEHVATQKTTAISSQTPPQMKKADPSETPDEGAS